MANMDGHSKIVFSKSNEEAKKRNTIMSADLINQIQDCHKRLTIKIYSFEAWATKQYGLTSGNIKLKMATEKSGIVKKWISEILRHISATHILEDGAGLRQIQLLLGHSSTKTTEIYTHVTKNHLKAVENSLDSLYLSNNQ